MSMAMMILPSSLVLVQLESRYALYTAGIRSYVKLYLKDDFFVAPDC